MGRDESPQTRTAHTVLPAQPVTAFSSAAAVRRSSFCPEINPGGGEPVPVANEAYDPDVARVARDPDHGDDPDYICVNFVSQVWLAATTTTMGA